jgi:hypothetical protein
MTGRVLHVSLATAVVAALLCVAVPARAGDPCLDEATQEGRECKAGCKEAYQLDRDDCLGKDHVCVEVCRAERAECREATGLEAVIRQCNLTLRAARQTCRDQNAEGTPERDQCIDQAQVVAFQCRDAAREAVRQDLIACRRQFRTCARECPPANPPVTIADRRQCRIDAKTEKEACLAICQENLQFQKDACRNRDHVCVEQCRAERETCRQPVEDQLEAAIAACKATRESQVQNCENLYGPGTPERDTCIDNAQVASFQCKDAARENAKPSFETCRDEFRACAEGCPPATIP